MEHSRVRVGVGQGRRAAAKVSLVRKESEKGFLALGSSYPQL